MVGLPERVLIRSRCKWSPSHQTQFEAASSELPPAPLRRCQNELSDVDRFLRVYDAMLSRLRGKSGKSVFNRKIRKSVTVYHDT